MMARLGTVNPTFLLFSHNWCLLNNARMMRIIILKGRQNISRCWFILTIHFKQSLMCLSIRTKKQTPVCLSPENWSIWTQTNIKSVIFLWIFNAVVQFCLQSTTIMSAGGGEQRHFEILSLCFGKNRWKLTTISRILLVY